jgi:hypothetical protein
MASKCSYVDDRGNLTVEYDGEVRRTEKFYDSEKETVMVVWVGGVLVEIRPIPKA